MRYRRYPPLLLHRRASCSFWSTASCSRAASITSTAGLRGVRAGAGPCGLASRRVPRSMLLGLLWRGVAFEFRHIATGSKPAWKASFAAGSTLDAVCLGIILGGVIQGIHVQDGAYAGGGFEWATPLAALCGLGVPVG